MSTQPSLNGQMDARRASAEAVIRRITSQVIGVAADQLSDGATFVELGADSLSLLQMSQTIHDELQVRIPFRLFFDEVSTPEAVVAHVLEHAPRLPLPDESPIRAAHVRPASGIAGAARSDIPPRVPQRLDSRSAARTLSDATVEQVLSMQLRIMEQQLSVLAGDGEQPGAVDVGDGAEPVGGAPTEPLPRTPTVVAEAPLSLSQRIDPEPYVAHRPVAEASTGLGLPQMAYLDSLTARLTRRTAASKRLAESYRAHLADNRATAGFNRDWKELCYPLVIERAHGSSVWDVDGHEYLDITMGFGALLCGHSPAFLMTALADQVGRGVQLGLQSRLAGEAARRLCELTGVDRVAFCNSGTEAIMAALRLARRATGREGVALFAGAYHGTFDGVMVKGRRIDGGFEPAPLAPGVPRHMIDNVTVLEYGSPAALAALAERARSCAAILVEPAQSRRPDVHPRQFLTALRRIADESGALLVFDEVVTGFRTHPGGAQALFGVQADLVAYGKALGGGLPVGAVAGRSAWMDAVDGGAWRFGDGSFPRAETTFVAGTYFKHPLIVAAVHAVLTHLAQTGTVLQQTLTRTTESLVERLNAIFSARRAPVRVVSFGSLFRFMAPKRVRAWELFYYALLDRGVYVCETRTCFLSTAHTAADLDRLVAAVDEVTMELMAAGVLPQGSAEADGSAAAAPPVDDAVPEEGDAAPTSLPLTDGQAGLLAAAALGPDWCRAYNESSGIRLDGPLDRGALRRALTSLIGRHEALRVAYLVEEGEQRIWPRVEVPLVESDLRGMRGLAAERELERLLEFEARTVIDLSSPPLMRLRLIRLAETRHVLCVTVHHLITDGWSLGLLLEELGASYTAEVSGTPAALPPAARLVDFVRDRRARPGLDRPAAEAYWRGRLTPPLAPPPLPFDHPRPGAPRFRGARARAPVSPDLYGRMKSFAASRRCTLFTLLVASVQTLLYGITGQDDIVVGAHAAARDGERAQSLLGFCTILLPVRASFGDGDTFDEHLRRVRDDLIEAFKHQDYPIGELLGSLPLSREPGRHPIVSVIVNLDRTPAGEPGEPGAEGALFAGLSAERLESPVVYARFELLFNFTETRGGLTLDCTYDRDLFDQSTIGHWLERYVALVAEAVVQPASPVEALGASLAADGNLATPLAVALHRRGLTSGCA